MERGGPGRLQLGNGGNDLRQADWFPGKASSLCGFQAAGSKVWLRSAKVQNLVISIVADDASFRTSMGRLVHSLGFKVLPFESARQFLASKESRSSACLIHDVHMPDIDGFQLAKQLLSRSHKLPIILQSGNATEADFQRAKTLGAPLLQKPVDAEKLLRTLKRVCSPIGDE
jgi:FixJ family two-component response regulator